MTRVRTGPGGGAFIDFHGMNRLSGFTTMVTFFRLPRMSASLLVLAVTAVVAQAQTAVSSPPPAVPLEPGFWQVLARPEMRGGAFMALPRTFNICVTPEDLVVGRVRVPSMPVCHAQEGGRWNGAKLTLKLACEGLAAESQVSGELQASGKSFAGQVEVILQPGKEGPDRGHFVYHQTAKWVADTCPAPRVMTPNGPLY